MVFPVPVTWIIYITAGVTFGILMFMWMEKEKLREWLPNRINIIGNSESAKRFIIQLEGRKPLDVHNNIIRYKQHVVKFPFIQSEMGKGIWNRSVTFFPVNFNRYDDNHWAEEILKKNVEILFYILDDKCNDEPLFLNPQFEAFENFVQTVSRWNHKERKSLKVLVFVLDTHRDDIRLSQYMPGYMPYIKDLALKFEDMAIINLKCDTENKEEVRNVVRQGLQVLDENNISFWAKMFITKGDGLL